MTAASRPSRLGSPRFAAVPPRPPSRGGLSAKPEEQRGWDLSLETDPELSALKTALQQEPARFRPGEADVSPDRTGGTPQHRAQPWLLVPTNPFPSPQRRLPRAPNAARTARSAQSPQRQLRPFLGCLRVARRHCNRARGRNCT